MAIADNNDLPLHQIILTAIVHISVGIAVVSITSFLNSEMKFIGWNSSTISIYLGAPVIFEISRLYFGYLYDQGGIIKLSYLLGFFLSLVGISLTPYFITQVGNFWIIITISLFYFGSAIMTTLVDSNLTDISGSDEKSGIAGSIQLLRLLGFAIGGFGGSFLYQMLEFTTFIHIISLIYALLGIISFTQLQKVEKSKKAIGFTNAMVQLKSIILQPLAGLMTIFLLIYPIGLFMQDLILEPYAIDIFGFDKQNVGIVVAIWTSLTLIFVPLGVYLEKKIDRSIPIYVGEVLAFLGLVGIGTSSIVINVGLFYTSLVFFGIGNGIASPPAISLMLEVCSLQKEHLSLLLGFFGILTTLGRFLSALTGGLILELTSSNYTLLFYIEAIFVILSLVPIILLIRRIQPLEENKDKDKNKISQNIDLL